MEAMAPDEMDQDHRQKSGREELEYTVQDQIRAKEHDIREQREGIRAKEDEIREKEEKIREKEEEIREKEEEIREKKEEIREKKEEIREKEEEIREKEEKIREKQEEIREKEEEIRGVEKQSAIASGTDVRKLLEEKLQFLRQQISSLDQQIISLDQQIISLRQQILSLRDQLLSLLQQITSLLQQITSLRQQITSRRQELSSRRSVQEAPASAEPRLTVETMKKLLEDVMAKVMRDNTAKSAISTLSMSSIVAQNVLKVAGFELVDGSAVEPAAEVSVLKEWEFDMGQYAGDEDCYEPFLKHMVKYLNAVHAVRIRKDPPREPGCCKLLDVHKLNNVLELEAELGDQTLKITGNLDAVFVPRNRGVLQFEDSLLGGVKVKHLTKEIFKYGAGYSGQSAVLGQALMEALAVYAYSDFPEGIFLLTTYDENVVMHLKGEEIYYWVELNFAQAMDKIAAFLKREDVQKFLEESEEPVRSRKRPHISESKRSVRKKLKIEGFGNEEFLAQVDVIRSTAGNKLEMISDLFQLMESWRYSTTGACGMASRLASFMS